MSALEQDIPVAILAGGLATRLRPLTEKLPKALIFVGGKPFLDHQLELLRRQGLRRVVMCVGYLGEMIQEQFGDGRSRGMQIAYSFDGPAPIGTGGALRHALPLLDDRFFVLYGDSYLPISFARVAEFFQASGKSGLMTVFRNRNRFDRSNVIFRSGKIILYNKRVPSPEMQHIDFGLTMFCKQAFGTHAPDGHFDLSELLTTLAEQDDLAGFEVSERFYEIGSLAGLAELDRKLTIAAT
jgi:NDP-sugar pyrophosphorylase family protein